MAGSGPKNTILIVVVLVALGAAAYIAGPKLWGPSAEAQITAIRDNGDPFCLQMGRQMNKEGDDRFKRVNVRLVFDEEAKNPEKSAKIIVGGKVRSAEDKAAVEKLVKDNNPPYPVDWELVVDGP